MNDKPNDRNLYIYPNPIQNERIFKYKFPWIILLVIGIICLLVLVFFRFTFDISLFIIVMLSCLLFTFLGSVGIIINLIIIDLKNQTNVGLRNPAIKWTLIFFDNLFIFITILYSGFVIKPLPDFILLIFFATAWLNIPLFIGMAFAWQHRPIKASQYQKYLRRQQIHPVIAVILMVAITVVLAGVLYVTPPYPPPEIPPYTQRPPEDLPDIDESWDDITENYHIREPTYWYKKKILVEHDVSIYVESKLTIDHSIIVFNETRRPYSEGGSIIVADQGQLIINNSRITITEVGNRWEKIVLAKNCTITNSTIEYIDYGIYIKSNNIRIENNTFKHCMSGIECGGNCNEVVIKNNKFISSDRDIDIDSHAKDLIIEGNLFENAYTGIVLGSFSNINKRVVENNTFRNCSTGIWSLSSQIPTLKNCIFDNNHNAIDIFNGWGGKITSCIFVNNAISLHLNFVSHLTIEDSVFKNNTNGIDCQHVTSLNIKNCTFIKTQKYDILVNSGSYVYISNTYFDQMTYLYKDEFSGIYLEGNELPSNYEPKIYTEQEPLSYSICGIFLIIFLILIITNLYYIYRYYDMKKMLFERRRER